MVSIEQLLRIVASSGLADDIGRFDPARSFKDNGIDSLDVMTLLLGVEEALDLKFSEDEFGRIQSLTDVRDVLADRA